MEEPKVVIEVSGGKNPPKVTPTTPNVEIEYKE